MLAAVRQLCRERSPYGSVSPDRGISKTPRQRALGCHRRACQIYLSVAGTASALEISIERAHGNAAAHRRTAHTNTRPARTFQYARASIQQVHERTVFRQHAEHLAGPRGYATVSRCVHLAAFEYIGKETQIRIRGVSARADSDLIDMHVC